MPFAPGQSILAAAQAAGHYIPHLCYHPEFAPHGSCKVCTVKVNGHTHASCTTPAHAGDVVESATDELTQLRLWGLCRGPSATLFAPGGIPAQPSQPQARA